MKAIDKETQAIIKLIKAWAQPDLRSIIWQEHSTTSGKFAQESDTLSPKRLDAESMPEFEPAKDRYRLGQKCSAQAVTLLNKWIQCIHKLLGN
jgi:glutathionyl-hydroquinone reductase